MDTNIVKKESRNNKVFILLLISLFIFSQEIREGILGNTFGIINVLSIFSVSYLFFNNFKELHKGKFILLYIIILIYIFTASLYEINLLTIIKCIISFMFPFILIITEVSKYTLKNIFKYTVIILNTIIVTITIIGILEITFNVNINNYLSNFMSARTQEQIIGNNMKESTKRLYSFMGHPLFNAQLYLMFLILNILYNKYFISKRCPMWIIIIATIGISYTGSKTGFVLLCISIMILIKSKHVMNKIILFILGMFAAFKVGLFDTLIYRFTAGSLTSGRTEKWNEIQSMNIYPLKFFTGYGNGFTFIFNSYVSWASAAFEYPFRMFSLEMGIMTTIMIYIFIMIIPLMALIKRKQWYLLLCYIIVFADINTFNGIALLGDKMMILSLFIFLILGLSKYIIETSLEETEQLV